MVLGSVLLPGIEKTVIVFAGQNGQSQPLKFNNIIDLEKNLVEEVHSEGFEGGCIVNEPLRYQDKIYSLVFKGNAKRATYEWELDSKQWKLLDIK